MVIAKDNWNFVVKLRQTGFTNPDNYDPMVNKYDFADFAKCYENENFKCAASVVYNCLYNSLSDEMALDPLYKANLESLFMGMHKDGIKFDTVSSFQGIVIKIHTVVITTGGFNLTESLN